MLYSDAERVAVKNAVEKKSKCRESKLYYVTSFGLFKFTEKVDLQK
jgi:hypothetical protein